MYTLKYLSEWPIYYYLKIACLNKYKFYTFGMKDPVAQRHEYGCGAACVAFVTNDSYENVVNKLGTRNAISKGFYCKELVSVIGEGYSFGYIKTSMRKRIYVDNVIVFIKRSKRYPAGHYLARHNNQWMDPWINFNQTKDIRYTKAGFRKRLPGKPIYYIFTEEQ